MITTYLQSRRAQEYWQVCLSCSGMRLTSAKQADDYSRLLLVLTVGYSWSHKGLLLVMTVGYSWCWQWWCWLWVTLGADSGGAVSVLLLVITVGWSWCLQSWCLQWASLGAYSRLLLVQTVAWYWQFANLDAYSCILLVLIVGYSWVT